MLKILKARLLQGHRTGSFPDTAPTLPDRFAGLPEVQSCTEKDCSACAEICPTGAIFKGESGVVLDMGKCIFCRKCENACSANQPAPSASSKDAGLKVNFVPLRGDFARGIFASVYTRAAEGMTLEDYRKVFEDYYAESSFVFHSNEGISMKEVVNTNKGLVHVELHDGYVHIASCIDNLVKGAAGQAVQNMNLMFGLPEDTGLRLKPSAF